MIQPLAYVGDENDDNQEQFQWVAAAHALAQWMWAVAWSASFCRVRNGFKWSQKYVFKRKHSDMNIWTQPLKKRRGRPCALLQVDCVRRSRDRKKCPAGGRLIMISCYSLEQLTSYSVVGFTDLTHPPPPPPPSVLYKTVAGTRILMQIRKRKMPTSPVSHLNLLPCFSLQLCPPLFFQFSTNWKLPRLPPSPSWFVSFSVFIAHDDYTSLRLPYLFISTQPTPNYAHQSSG